MNIFYLDKNPILAAEYHCDKHVVKMCLETAQILCTVYHKAGIDAPYKPTHQNHPSVLWAAESATHSLWLKILGIHLCEEYEFRYGKTHKCKDIIKSFDPTKLSCKVALFSHPPLCMPDEFKCEDPVQSYRNYYIKGKAHILKWSKRPAPSWLNE